MSSTSSSHSVTEVDPTLRELKGTSIIRYRKINTVTEVDPTLRELKVFWLVSSGRGRHAVTEVDPTLRELKVHNGG